MHMQAYYFVPLKEGSLYWLLLNLSYWYDTCFHVYLTKSKFKMICTTLYKINIYTTYMHYIQDICTGTCSTTFFHTAQVRNLKRINECCTVISEHVLWHVVIFNFVLRFNSPIKPHHFQLIKESFYLLSINCWRKLTWYSHYTVKK